MDKGFIDLGFIKIYYYSICILFGFLAGILVIYLELRKEKDWVKNKEEFIDILFYTFLWGLVGARVYYVLFNLSYYLANPLEIVMVWHGGLAIHGGILGGLAYLFYYHKCKRKINILKLLDILVVGLIIGQAIGRWGNFFNHEAYGAVCSLASLKNQHIPSFIIKGMYINGSYHYPTFFYESISSFLGFLILFFAKNKKVKLGQLSGIYLVWYSISRFFIEGMRLDSLMLGPLRVAQFVSICLFLIGIYLLGRRNTKLYREVNLYDEV